MVAAFRSRRPQDGAPRGTEQAAPGHGTKLYEHVRAGHSLPALPASIMGEDRLLLHDIVAYVRALPMGVTGRHEQAQCQIPRPDAAAAVSFSQPQPEASPCPDFAAAATQLNTITASSMQQDPLLTGYDPAQAEYESLESRLDLQELWTLMEVDPAEAARLDDWLLNYTA
jgi:hypothetical protein